MKEKLEKMKNIVDALRRHEEWQYNHSTDVLLSGSGTDSNPITQLHREAQKRSAARIQKLENILEMLENF